VSLATGHTEERVCWTRMHAEAGEGLARIVRRKDLERRAGNGLFFWGVGNAPSRAIPALARAADVIDVLFSVMKSKPKVHDVAPSRVLAWRSYVDVNGVVRPIPPNVLVTSRASSRDHHYALMCRSDSTLDVADEGPFDPSAYRNLGAGGAVGNSQVTALLERCAPDGSAGYRVAMRARLTGGLWVKLVDPVEVAGSIRTALEGVPKDEDAWLELVGYVRSHGRPVSEVRQPAQASLFAI
jgi:limonene-1,2-epoxide hydrolase